MSKDLSNAFGNGATNSATSPASAPADLRARSWAVGIGNFMEWFDFAIYGYFAGVIGRVFFPSSEQGVSLLASLAVFAVGFLSRPLGALILGPLGDRFGRRFVLVLTVFGMGTCTTLIGLLPGYQSFGLAAPALLVALRFLQGVMVGGEWSSAGVYIVESAPAAARARAASTITATAGLAFLIGTFIAAAISTSLSADALSAWGWRLPFVASLAMTAVAIYIRRRLGETPVFEAVQLKRAERLVEAVPTKERWRAFVTTFAFSALFGVSLYYFITYANSHLTQTVGLPRTASLWLCSAALLVYTVIHSAIGKLSDRIGRRPLVLGSAFLLAILGYPIFWLMNTGNYVAIFCALVVLGVLVAVTAVMDVVLLVEVFPASIRSTGAALGHNMALAILAGPGPFIASALIHYTHNTTVPAAYLSVISLVCGLVLWRLLPETSKSDITRG